MSRLYWRPFHEVMARVSALKLGEKPKIVLLAVLRYANKEGRAWPSLKTLAADTEMSVSSVARAIERVKERVPAVTIERQGKTKPNLYSVPVEWVYGAGLIGQPDQSLEASTADRRGVIGQTDPSDRSGSAGVIGQPDHRSSTNSKKDFQEEIRHSHRSKRPTDATPSRAELLEGFDAVWEALPKVLSYGDATVRS